MDNLDHVKGSTIPVYETGARYSGFWRRVFAYIADAIIITILFTIIIVVPIGLGFIFVSTGVYFLLLFIIYTLYETIFISSRMMATPGKRLFVIKVTDLNGNRISFARVLLRTVVKFGLIFVGRIPPVIGLLSWLNLLNPFLIVLTEKKQAIHDYIAGTVVVRMQE